MAYINGKEILFSPNISISGNLDDLQAIIKAIATMGGTVADDANYDEIPNAIETIPVGDATYTLVEDSGTAYRKAILSGAAKYAEINQIGGMSYKSTNLFDDAVLANIGMTKTAEHEYYSAQNYLYGDQQIFVNTSGISGAFTISGKLKYADVGSTSSGLYAKVVYTDGTQTGFSPSNKKYDEYFDYVATTDASKTVAYISFTYGSSTVSTHIKELQIERGETATAFKPYFAGFRHAKATELKSEGKNLIDDAVLAEIGMTKTAEHEYYSEENYLYGDQQIFVNTSGISGAFTISGKLKYADVGSTSSGLYAKVVYTDGTQTGFSPSNKKYDEYFDYVATTDASKTVAYISFTYGSSTVSTHIKELQIERGETATEYKPFAIIDTFTLPEAVRNREGYGIGVNADYYNYIEYAANGVKEWLKCIEKVFDGTENWQRIDAENNFKLDGLTSALTPVKELGGSPSIMLCNHYTPRFANEQGCAYMSNNSFSFIDANYPTVGEWKMHLATLKDNGNPLTVVYALKYPTETDITDLMPKDNYIAIEEGGSIIAVNDHELDAPVTISYVREVG